MSVVKEYLTVLRGNILVLVSSMIIWNFMLQMVFTYEALYIFAIGGSGVILGGLSLSQTLLSTFLRIPGGYLADKRGRRVVIGLSVIVASFGYLFYVFAGSWFWLLPGVFLLSIFGLAEPAVEAIKADSIEPEERGKGYAVLNTLPRISALIAPAIGGILIADNISEFGISIPWMRNAYLGLFFGVLIAGLIRLLFLKDVYLPEGEKSEKAQNMFRDVYDAVNESSSSVKKLLVLGGFFMFCFHLDAGVRSIYAINVGGLSTIEWGIIVSSTSVVSMLSTFVIGWAVDSYGRKKVFIPAIVSLGLGTLLFAFADSFNMFLLSRVIGSIGLYGRMIAFQVFVADSVPVVVRGRIMGVYNIFSSLGSSAALMVSGILYDFTPVFPFYASFSAYILAALVAYKFIHEPAHT